ncbi:hypothetical protein H6P81_020737 [Aristolochia fimbriata]|uniref:Ribosomal protein S11 n=1 Tax=Aristolochia fimbriata TaxID=158543 RepID=A0AAV7DV98_ARIFI|nr:hypothetical protein H6P81_020737 [Aristolochia fimbriata]
MGFQSNNKLQQPVRNNRQEHTTVRSTKNFHFMGGKPCGNYCGTRDTTWWVRIRPTHLDFTHMSRRAQRLGLRIRRGPGGLTVHRFHSSINVNDICTSLDSMRKISTRVIERSRRDRRTPAVKLRPFRAGGPTIQGL